MNEDIMRTNLRFGCCVNMLVPPDQGTGIAMVEVAATAGFDYIEMPLRRLAALPAQDFAEVQQRLGTAGLRCETCNDFLPAAIRVCGPGTERQRQLDYAEGACARAAQLGVDTIVFGSADARRAPEGCTAEQASGQIAGFLEALVPILDRHHITIAIEHLNRGECNTLTSLAEAAALVEAIGQPRIRLLADYYHLHVEHEPIAHLAVHLPLVRHVHVSHPHGRGYITEADADVSSLMSCLTRGGYAGRISIEGYTDDLARTGPAALALLRSLTHTAT